MNVDIHQHVWPDALIEELRRRSRPPRLDGWTLLTSGEPPFAVNPADHDVARRAAQAAHDGVGLVVVGMSSPLGIEYLMPEEAQPLLDAYHHGVTELGSPFAGWAAACLAEIDAPGLGQAARPGVRRAAAASDRGRPTSPVTAGAARCSTCSPSGNFRSSSTRGLRPGRGRTARRWWPALVPYVQQMHAAWFAFRAYGRPAYPRLRVCFAALAGLAPLHGERLAARGGADPLARGVVDPRMFAETSSYGNRAVDSVLRVLGVDMLVFGSDRPYAQPQPYFGPGDAARPCHSGDQPGPAAG